MSDGSGKGSDVPRERWWVFSTEAAAKVQMFLVSVGGCPAQRRRTRFRDICIVDVGMCPVQTLVQRGCLHPVLSNLVSITWSVCGAMHLPAE